MPTLPIPSFGQPIDTPSMNISGNTGIGNSSSLFGNSGNPAPGGGNPAPGGGNPVPGGGNPAPRGGNPAPGGGNPAPGGGPSAPGGAEAATAPPVPGPRTKERDSAKFPPLPTDTGLTMYQAEVTQLSITGSGRAEAALQWHNEIMVMPMEQLENIQEGWSSWDAKCLEGLKQTLRAPERQELLRRINQKISDRFKEGRLFSYRAAMKMLYEEYERDPNRKHSRAIKDLSALQLKDFKEPGLRAFLGKYMEIATMMKATFREDHHMTRALLFNKLVDELEKAPNLREPFMSHFKRNSTSPSIYNLEWLEQHFVQYLEDLKLEKTEKRLDEQRSTSSTTTAPATSVAESSNTAGSNKKKGANKQNNRGTAGSNIGNAATGSPNVAAPATKAPPTESLGKPNQPNVAQGGNATYLARVPLQHAKANAACCVPHSHRLVARRGHQPPPIGKCDNTTHPARVPLQHAQTNPASRIPQPHRLVDRRGRQPAPVT